MSDDDLETRLREGLRAATLPAAPGSLRRILADVPAPERAPSRLRQRDVILLTAAVVLLGLGAAGVLIGAPQRQHQGEPAPTPVPTLGAASPTPAAPTAAPLPAGFLSFQAPGIRFAHPANWARSSAFDNYPDVLGRRIVATFERGMTRCPNTEGVDPMPTKPPGGCATEAGPPGSLVVQVVEFTHQFPPTDEYGARTEFAGYSAWTRDEDDSDPATMSWVVAGPDDSLYIFWTSLAREDIDDVRAEMEATLGSLQLSSWQEPEDVVDGRVHVETGQGFAFDYPAGWKVYYPRDVSMRDHAIATVVSGALGVCDGESCQRFTTPPGTIVMDFRVGRGPTEPDWSKATATVGGQPAFLEHWGPESATGADEGHQWNVRLDGDRNVLGIYASLRGPGLPAQRESMDSILESVTINAPPPGAP